MVFLFVVVCWHWAIIILSLISWCIIFVCLCCFEPRDIWSRFLAFESQVGDLASIVKVEKRRAQTIEKVNVLELFNHIQIFLFPAHLPQKT